MSSEPPQRGTRSALGLDGTRRLFARRAATLSVRTARGSRRVAPWSSPARERAFSCSFSSARPGLMPAPGSRPSQLAAFGERNRFNLRLWNSVNPVFCFKRESAWYHILRNLTKFFKKIKCFSASGSPAGLVFGGRALTWARPPHREPRRAGDLAAGRRRAPRPGRAGGTAVSRPLAPSGVRGGSCRLRLERRVPRSLPTAAPAIPVQVASTFCLGRAPAT